VGRRPRPLRHRQARPALRDGAGRPEPGVRRHRGAGLLGSHVKALVRPGGAASPAPGSTRWSSRPRGRRGGPGLVPGRRPPPLPVRDRRRGRWAVPRLAPRPLPVGAERAASCRRPGRPRATSSWPSRTPPDRLHRAGARCGAIGLAAGRPGPAPLRLGGRLPDVRRASTPTATRRRRTTRSPCPTPTTCRCWHRPVRRALAGLRPGAQRVGAGIGQRPYPPPGHPVAGLRRAGHQRRGGRGPLRVPARRLPLRGAAARRLRLRHRPPGGHPGRRGEHPRGHRLPQDPVRCRPPDRGAPRCPPPAWPSWASAPWCPAQRA
jgi:hypothetical protein